jgi:hypothetical protein
MTHAKISESYIAGTLFFRLYATISSFAVPDKKFGTWKFWVFGQWFQNGDAISRPSGAGNLVSINIPAVDKFTITPKTALTPAGTFGADKLLYSHIQVDAPAYPAEICLLGIEYTYRIQ